MYEEMKNFEEGYNKLTSMAIKEYFTTDIINGMSGKDFEVAKAMMQFADSSIKLMKEEADIIERINRKLDTLLELKKD